MTNETPRVVLVHGAFAESASWDGVISRLHERGIEATAIANPLRTLSGDADYVRDVIASIGHPVVLVGHSYGGMVMTEAASRNNAVLGLVYVAAFAPDTGESALELSNSAPGSTLGDALNAYELSTGGREFAIREDAYHHQFAADASDGQAVLMAATQRPVAEVALTEKLATDVPAWRTIPSWFVFGDADLNIPVAVHRAGADRASSRESREIAGASHAIGVSRPAEVADVIATAVAEVTR